MTYPGVPVPERLTLQREANDLCEQIQKANAMLEHLIAGPTPSSDQKNAVLMPVGAAISTSRNEIGRLIERLDQLIQAVGQI
jgi:hypothetical protein